jgi:DNA-binding response OmpR family regulator
MTLEQLQIENDELRERIRQMEDAAGFNLDAPPQLLLSPLEARVLGVFRRHERVSREQLLQAAYAHRPNHIPEIKIVDVVVCNLREKTLKFGIAIRTHWGFGYSLSPDSKAIIEQLLTPEPVL